MIRYIKFFIYPEFLYFSVLVLTALLIIFWVSFFFLKYKFQKEISLKARTITSVILTFLLLVAAISSLILEPKIISPTDPSLSAVTFSDKQPISIKFDRKVSPKSLSYEITPEIKGNWHLCQNWWKYSGSELTFTPTQSPKLETRYTVSIGGIQGIINFKESRYLFSLETLALPLVKSASIAEGDKGILPTQDLSITLDQDISDVAGLAFELTPLADLEISHDSRTYKIKSKEPLKKGSKYCLTVFREVSMLDYVLGKKVLESRTELSKINFETVDAPGIKSYSPDGNQVLPSEAVVLEFLQNMDRVSTEKAFSISPTVEGVFSWRDDRTLVFQPTILQKETKYNVSLSTSALAADSSPLEEIISFNFTTIGAVSIASSSPVNGATGAPLDQKISIVFNQDVDKSSAQSKFSISPSVQGAFSWSGRTLIFAPINNLAYATKYTVEFSADIVSVNGINSRKVLGLSFTTIVQSVNLRVTAYRQSHMYSCMISAAKSALEYRGVSRSEADIISRIGYDTTPWSGTWNEGGAVWGDPGVGIVGDLDGNANNIGWGYGSHWAPIAQVIESYGVSTETRSGMTAAELATQIAAGNPVIIWWVNGVWPAYEVNWKTPNGKNIRAVNAMHVQVVKGFVGSVDNPTSFTVTDSGYGYPNKTFDTATFLAKWSWFSNTGIIVK